MVELCKSRTNILVSILLLCFLHLKSFGTFSTLFNLDFDPVLNFVIIQEETDHLFRFEIPRLSFKAAALYDHPVYLRLLPGSLQDSLLDCSLADEPVDGDLASLAQPGEKYCHHITPHY